jgi:hypothetical protein
MLRRILAVASEQLTRDEKYGLFTYFELLKKRNDKAPEDKRRPIEELLLLALSAYLPQRWRDIRYRPHNAL